MTSSNALIGGSLMIRYHWPSGLKHLVVLPQLSERASLYLLLLSFLLQVRRGKCLVACGLSGRLNCLFFHEVKVKHLTFKVKPGY